MEMTAADVFVLCVSVLALGVNIGILLAGIYR